jgi:hypothetical protein
MTVRPTFTITCRTWIGPGTLSGPCGAALNLKWYDSEMPSDYGGSRGEKLIICAPPRRVPAAAARTVCPLRVRRRQRISVTKPFRANKNTAAEHCPNFLSNNPPQDRQSTSLKSRDKSRGGRHCGCQNRLQYGVKLSFSRNTREFTETFINFQTIVNKDTNSIDLLLP